MNGEVLDLDRVEYLRMHLEMLSQAIADGGRVRCPVDKINLRGDPPGT